MFAGIDAGFVLLMIAICITSWVISKPFRKVAVALTSK